MLAIFATDFDSEGWTDKLREAVQYRREMLRANSCKYNTLAQICLEAKLLITEVACDGGSAVTVAGGNDLAVALNEHRVSKSFATAECCAYKAAVTERRVYLPVGKIACQAKVGWTRNSIHVGERRLPNRDNVAVCLGSNSKCLRKKIAWERGCNAAMSAKAVVDRAVTGVAHQ